jgi:hypothetical protein
MSNVRVWGPITGGERGWPFGAAISDIGAAGYLEEEFFFEGEAPLYRVAGGGTQTADGRWDTERAGAASFRSRILVRRPADPAQFNGTAVVYWNNVTAGFENLLNESAEPLNGFAMVFVSAQRAGVHGFDDEPKQGLHTWDPERYGSLHIAHDDLSYGILTLAARLTGPDRPRTPVDPMGGLDVKRVLAGGASQSAGRLSAYINGVQPIERIFDGFLLTIYFGSATPLNTDGAPPVRPGGGQMRRNPVRLREDIRVPVFVVNTETETPSYTLARQPDTDQFRFWEMAGAAHVTTAGSALAMARFRRDWGMDRPAMAFKTLPNSLPTAPVQDAALAAMQRWMAEATPPPCFDRIQASGDPPVIARDADGNALGGIRVPDFDVPIATSTGVGDGSDPLAFLFGSTVPFSTGRLRALYGSAGAYLAAYRASVERGIAAGYLLARDREPLIAAAEARQGLFG